MYIQFHFTRHPKINSIRIAPKLASRNDLGPWIPQSLLAYLLWNHCNASTLDGSNGKKREKKDRHRDGKEGVKKEIAKKKTVHDPAQQM